MASEQRRYVAYLLRLWQASDTEGSAWRASLEDPHTGERQGFASLERLFAFLEEQISAGTRYEERPRGIDTDLH